MDGRCTSHENKTFRSRSVVKQRNGVWVLEDGDSCHKTGKIDLPFFSVLQKSSPRRYPMWFDCGILSWIYSRGMDVSSPLQLIAPGTLLRIYTTQTQTYL